VTIGRPNIALQPTSPSPRLSFRTLGDTELLRWLQVGRIHDL